MNPIEPSASQAEYTHLGAYFRDLREHYELDVAQVAARLHIRPKYIEAIEVGDMAALPARVYAQGYIYSYAEFLGLDAAAVMQQYDGLSKAPADPQFRIVAPTKQTGIPAWRLIAVGALVALLAIAALRWLFAAPEAQIQSAIEPVPQRLLEQTQAPLSITPQNEACLQLVRPRGVLPCYYQPDAPPAAPLGSLMELVK